MTPATPRRADAQRNRARLLDAARTVLARRGPAASMDEIARTAGLGAGTLYRHFPDRKRLVDAILAESIAQTIADFQAAVDVDDPAVALYGTLHTFASRVVRDRALAESISSRDTDRELAAARARAAEILTSLVARAQAAGVLRADVTARDLIWLTRAIAFCHGFDAESDDWERFLQIVFAGLRPPRKP